MKEVVYYNELFDCYNKLLTKNEWDCFKDYYNEDLSYSEIAINKNVSRSAVQKTIKIVLEKLEDYEEKIQLLKTKKKLIDLTKETDIDKIKKDIKKLLEE